MPDQIAAANNGTSSRPMAMASWRCRERDQNRRIFSVVLSDEYGIVHTSLREPSRTKCATVTPAARPSVRIGVITAVRQSVVQAEFDSLPDDFRHGHHRQRGVNPECTSLHTFCGRQRREMLEGGD